MDCCCNNKLKQIKNENVEYFSFDGYKCKAKVVSVYDGDTFTACFKYRGQIIKYRFRTFGYDSPEMKPLKSKPNREEEKAKADAEAAEAAKAEAAAAEEAKKAEAEAETEETPEEEKAA